MELLLQFASRNSVFLAIANRAAEVVSKKSILPIAERGCGKGSTKKFLTFESHAIQTGFSAADGVSERNLASYPPIHYHVITGAMVCSYSSAFRNEEALLLPHYEFAHRERFTCAKVLFYEETPKAALVSNALSESKLPRGIFLAGNGAFNYYHWLIEVLSLVPLIDRLPKRFQSFPLLLPAEAGEIPSFIESLDLMVGDRFERIFLKDPKKWTQVDELIAIDPVCETPFNFRMQHRPKAKDSKICEDAFKLYQSRIRQVVGVSPQFRRKLVFLDRPSDRRPYNRQEVIAAMRQLGAGIVDTAALSFREQAELFSSSRLIVGPSGAAWANLLFCTPGASAIIWAVEYHRDFTAFSNLAASAGVKLRRLVATSQEASLTSRSAYHSPYSIDPGSLVSAVEKALQELQ